MFRAAFWVRSASHAWSAAPPRPRRHKPRPRRRPRLLPRIRCTIIGTVPACRCIQPRQVRQRLRRRRLRPRERRLRRCRMRISARHGRRWTAGARSRPGRCPSIIRRTGMATCQGPAHRTWITARHPACRAYSIRRRSPAPRRSPCRRRMRGVDVPGFWIGSIQKARRRARLTLPHPASSKPAPSSPGASRLWR